MATITSLGKVRYNYKGTYQGNINYDVDDVVTYKNRSYRCISSGAGFTPTGYEGSKWERWVSALEDQGIWNAATAYKIGDVVTVDASPYVSASGPRTLSSSRPLIRSVATFVAIADSTNQSPPTSGTGNGYWQLMSESGGKASIAVGWPADGTIVPAVGVYETGASPGWGPSGTVNGVSAAARPGDSFEDGGLGGAYSGTTLRPAYITRNGGYVTWGLANSGATGTGGNDAVSEFMEISFPLNEWFDGTLPTPDGLAPKVIQAFAHESQHFVLMNNGEVYSWGYGAHGQNGSGNNNSINAPVRCGNNNNTTVLRGKKAIRIATTSGSGGSPADASARYALMSDGTLWSWGYNGYGQLGLGNTTNYNVPTQITTSGLNGTVVDIWAGGYDYGVLYVLTSTGYMYACGRAAHGQSGTGSTTQYSTLTLVKAWGTTTTKVIKFAIGNRQDANFCAVLDASYQLWMWGYNGSGQLGFDTTTNTLTPTAVTTNGTDVRNVWLSSGDYGSSYIIRTSTYQAYSCGYNGYYNLGRPQATTPFTHASGGNSGTAYDTYRFQPMYVEVTTVSPYYGTINNVHEIKTWQVDSSYTAVMIEQKTGNKYCGGYQGYGHFGFHHADAYLNRTRDSAMGVSNNLFKRLRYLPSGRTEAEIGCLPIAYSSNGFGAIWYDRYGTTYFTGYDAGWHYAMHWDNSNSIVNRVCAMIKLPGA